MYQIDSKALMDFLTEEQILSILKTYGLFPQKINAKEFWFRTACHDGDSHKLCYFRKDKDFFCYTNCGKMSFFSLLMKLENRSFPEIISKVAKEVSFYTFGSSFQSSFINKDLDLLKKNLLLKQKKQSSKIFLPEFDEKILNYFDNRAFYKGWIDEGITIPSMWKYKISWYDIDNFIIIPHFDENNRLVGIRRRIIPREDEIILGNKYMPLIKNGIGDFAHSLGMNLYGLNCAKEAIRKSKKAIVVEGEKSVLLSDSYFGEDSIAVATCGFNITEIQKKILLSLGVEEIIIGFDKDFDPLEFKDFTTNDKEDKEYQAYLRFISTIEKLGMKFSSFCRVSVLWDEENILQKKDSPFDRGRDNLIHLLQNRKEINFDKLV